MPPRNYEQYMDTSREPLAPKEQRRQIDSASRPAEKPLPPREPIPQPGQPEVREDSGESVTVLFPPMERAAAEARAAEQTLQKALEILQGCLQGFEDYALFGSTALYLRRQAVGEKSPLPDDLDIVCGDEQALREVKRRLARIPGIHIELEEGGGFFSFPGQVDAKFFSGWIPVGDREIPFECFSENRIAGIEDVYKHRSRTHSGLVPLTGEGLKNQYLHTLEMDRRIDRSVKQVVTRLAPFLHRTDSHADIRAQADVTEDDITWLSEELLVDDMEERLLRLPEDERETERKKLMAQELATRFTNPFFTQEAARRFAGIKTKTARREAAVEALTQRSQETSSASQTETPPLEKAA